MKSLAAAIMAIFIGMQSMAAHGENLPQGTVLSGDTLVPRNSLEGEAKDNRLLPGDQTIPHYQISDPELRAAAERSRKILAGEEANPIGEASATMPSPTEDKDDAPQLEQKPPTSIVRRHQPIISHEEAPVPHPAFTDMKDGVRIFNRALQGKKMKSYESFSLPSTSVALATTLYGIEATGSIDRYVPAELNYAWLGPNGAVVEMKYCRLWILVRGDYSTERIYGQAKTMSCRAPSGETFDLPINAHVVDQGEEYLGAKGSLVARGKALASALSFLSDGVKAFGSAMAAAQVDTEVASGGDDGGPVKSSNVRGDKNKYIAGQSLAGSSARFLDWWIDYYQSLSPTIAIGPGKKIYLALQGTVKVPKMFFGASIDAKDFAPGQEPSKLNAKDQRVNTDRPKELRSDEAESFGAYTKSQEEGG